MISEKQILEKRAQVFAAMQDIANTAKSENRSMTAEENASFEKADADFNTYTEQLNELRGTNANLNKLQSYADLLDEKTTVDVTETRNVNATATAKPNGDAFRSALDKWLRWGPEGITAEERKVLSTYEQRGTSTQVSTTANLGGYAMPEEWARELYRSMLYYGGALEACGIKYNTSHGGDLHVPTVNDTSNTGALIAQGIGDTVKDITFSEIIFKRWGYTSGLVKVSMESFDDLTFDINAEVRDICAERLGRILNTHFTTGDNTNKPQGLVPGSTLGKAATDDTTLTRNELVDLVHSVDRAYRSGPKVGFMFNDATLSYLKKLAFGTGDDRPLWQPSIREGEPDRLEGYQYWVNNDMASIAASAKPILFGNFDKYRIRQTGGYVLGRSTERYFDERVVAFYTFCQFDGRYIDTAAVKHLLMDDGA